ncbi:MAG: hypothetical protein JXB62_11805 [Pirellulales bacterium]|nr:hypothetical protein [Pirellulales bacterium]
MEWVVQIVNSSGPNVCPSCGKLFFMSAEPSTPLWIWGVLLVLAANLYFMI